MAEMLASATHNGIRFNSEFFDQAAIDRLLNLHPPKVSATSAKRLVSLECKKPVFREEPFDDIAFEKAFQDAIDICNEDPDLERILAKRTPMLDQANFDLKTQLLNPSIKTDVAENNEIARNTLDIVTDPDGVVAFEVAGTRLLEVNPTLRGGSTYQQIIQIAVVVFDIFSLLCTVIGIMIDCKSDWAKRVATFIENLGQKMIDWAGRLKNYVGDLISTLSGGPSSAGWIANVKDCAMKIGAFLVEIAKSGWEERAFISSLRYCLKILFTGSWIQIGYYMLQLVASVALMVSTGGGYLVAKIIVAVIQLATFIWDTITLIRMFAERVGDEIMRSVVT
ncbi:MAG: hypothetical protein NTX42_01185 [Methanothrix sp.]|nr:hypothetical protein [Methanothrix sp.]